VVREGSLISSNSLASIGKAQCASVIDAFISLYNAPEREKSANLEESISKTKGRGEKVDVISGMREGRVGVVERERKAVVGYLRFGLTGAQVPSMPLHCRLWLVLLTTPLADDFLRNASLP